LPKRIPTRANPPGLPAVGRAHEWRKKIEENTAMRTVGKFIDVYNAVRELMEDSTHSPRDPVIRREGDQWMLESKLTPSPDAEIEIPMESFVSWWYESLRRGEQPTEQAISEYISQVAIREKT
jgi:hypothetical protein